MKEKQIEIVQADGSIVKQKASEAAVFLSELNDEYVRELALREIVKLCKDRLEFFEPRIGAELDFQGFMQTVLLIALRGVPE